MARATLPGSLPGELTSFVGRRRELAEVRRLLGQSRLVTLTGFGGVGKTRLALRAAGDSARSVSDGVWLADLSTLRDPGLVTPAVVAALGIREDSTHWSMSALADYLRDRSVLLVLDNCEHVLEACAALAEALLRRTSALRILATSRQPLGVPGERIFDVPPLPVPDPERPVPPAKALVSYDAVALFLGRAQAADRSFSLNDENAEAVTRLAQRLGGIPLALELAAARLRVLSPRQILDRLDDKYHLVTPAARTAIPRQENLQSLIDWSYDLCTSEEQGLWACLSVFPGDFELDAVEAICSGGKVPQARVLPALSGLVDKSIVTVIRNPDSVRYSLLGPLRQYGDQLLLTDTERADLQGRHRDHYRQLAERWSREWFGPRQVEWTAWAQVEQANLRAALEYCLSDAREIDAGLAMVATMANHWAHAGSLSEGRRYVDRLLATAGEPSSGRADALWTAAWIALNQGDTDAGEAAGREGVALAERFGNVRALGMGLLFQGIAHLMSGDVASAERLFAEAYRRAGSDPVIAALALSRSGEAAAQRGDSAAATEFFDQCLELCEAHGDLWIRGNALLTRSMLAWQEADVDTAASAAADALVCHRPFHDRLYVTQCLELLAWVAGARADHLHAARLLGAAGQIRQELGSRILATHQPHHDRAEREASRALGPGAYAKAAEEGAALEITEAMSFALGESSKPTPSRATDDAVLTPREREVASLVAEGLSNREIATRLVLSTRTVDVHVEHILTKLGFTSRSQVAAWMVEQREWRAGD